MAPSPEGDNGPQDHSVRIKRGPVPDRRGVFALAPRIDPRPPPRPILSIRDVHRRRQRPLPVEDLAEPAPRRAGPPSPDPGLRTGPARRRSGVSAALEAAGTKWGEDRRVWEPSHLPDARRSGGVRLFPA